MVDTQPGSGPQHDNFPPGSTMLPRDIIPPICHIRLWQKRGCIHQIYRFQNRSPTSQNQNSLPATRIHSSSRGIRTALHTSCTRPLIQNGMYFPSPPICTLNQPHTIANMSKCLVHNTTESALPHGQLPNRISSTTMGIATRE